MRKALGILIFFIFITNMLRAQYCSKLRRICRSNFNNEVFWSYNQSVPCGTFKEYNIFGRDKTSSPYSLLQSITSEQITFWNHTNANFPTNKNWDYYIETVYTCSGEDKHCYSDTQNVSTFNLPKSAIAYVSIDTISGLPLIVWEKNIHPTFWYVDLFNDNSIKTSITDTFFFDNISGGNPKSSPLKYVLAAVDSCTNRWDYVPADYHYTINLKGSVDTCLNKVSLNWTPYVGWGSDITYYYVYKKINNTYYKLIDSVNSTTFSYIDKINNKEDIEFCVASVNSENIGYRSFSNSIDITTGIRNNLHDLKINFVTLNNNIDVNISFNSTSDLEEINIYKSMDKTNFVLFKTLSKNINPVTVSDLNENGLRRVYYYLTSKNSCSVWSDTTLISSNILLNKNQKTNEIDLSFNNYSTWNNGVDSYKIQKETRLNDIVLNPYMLLVSFSDTFYVDNIKQMNNGEKYCYKVIASENNTGAISISNEVCIVGGLTVYFPNGIIDKNSTGYFKPIGSYIDYSKSYMNIYNRWGEIIKEIVDLNIGWDLTDKNNMFVGTETFVYDAIIHGLDGKLEQKKGTITIIR